MTYQVADQVNGVFGDTYSTLKEAEAALREAIEEGGGAEAASGEISLEDARRKATSFFAIVDAETGEEV